VLAGIVAIKEMEGPEIPFKPGRTDYVDETKLPPRGRLPDGSKGGDHLRQVFYRMGFNDQEIVALSGAHNLGRCHSDRSGFEGAWVPNPTRFSNSYFRLMVSMDWKEKTLKNGVKQFVNVDEDTGTELMMLPSDLALRDDKEFRKWVDLYAKDKERFFEDFSKAFGKLVELGLKRDGKGNVINSDNKYGGYISAPKKSDDPGAPEKVGDGEAAPLAKENKKFKAKL